MKLAKWKLGLAISATLTFSGAALAADSGPTPEQMMQEIHRLQEKVEKLEARDAAPGAKAESAPAAPTVEHSFDTAQAVQADADRRSQFLDITNPFTAGWDGKGFILKSEDGNFSFHPSFLVDVRDMTSFRQSIPAKGGGETNSTGYDTQNGFDLTRVRLTVDGTLYKNINYFVQLQADQGAALGLLDAYGTYKIADGPFSFKVGQFKDPVWHERNISEANLLAVDRTLVESLLGGGQTSRVQGAALLYDKDRFRAQAVFHDGFNSINTKFFDAGGIGAGIGGGAGVTPTNFGTSGRAEYLLIGDRSADFNPYSEYDQFTSLKARQNILVLGVGADYSQASANDVLFHTVDAQFNSPSGLSIFAAYLGSSRDLHTNQGVARPGIYYDAGFVAQAGYIFDQRIEPFVRYDYTKLARHSVTGLASDIAQEATVGVNYYLHGQKAKFTLDGSWLPDGAPSDSDALGILKDSGNTEFLLRAQFQLQI